MMVVAADAGQACSGIHASPRGDPCRHTIHTHTVSTALVTHCTSNASQIFLTILLFRLPVPRLLLLLLWGLRLQAHTSRMPVIGTFIVETIKPMPTGLRITT